MFLVSIRFFCESCKPKLVCGETWRGLHHRDLCNRNRNHGKLHACTILYVYVSMTNYCSFVLIMFWQTYDRFFRFSIQLYIIVTFYCAEISISNQIPSQGLGMEVLYFGRYGNERFYFAMNYLHRLLITTQYILICQSRSPSRVL